MKNTKRVFIAFIMFLFLISLVNAQDYAIFSGKFYDLKNGEEKIEFEFYNGTYSICENEKKTAPILVVNKDANIDNTYSLNIIGASWISLSAKEFSLPKKQRGVVFLDLSPGKDTNGLYNVKIIGMSAAGNVERGLNLNVNVENCYSLNLELEKEEDKVCSGTKNKYSGELANDANQKNEIKLDVKGPNWVSISKDIFSVGANESEKFEINADVPVNARGIFNIVVSAVLQSFPSIKSEKKLSIEVVPQYDCYKADILSDAEIKNYYSHAYIPIKIRNTGINQAAYDISLEAPNWITIEPKKLILNPQQHENLNLNINPDNEVPEGTYAIKINIKHEDDVYSKNIDVVLAKENKFLKGAKEFFAFYRFYIYSALFIAVILLVFRLRISNKIKTKYKDYKIRKARLKALEKARKARLSKIRLKNETEIKTAEFKVNKAVKYKRFSLWIFFLIGIIIIASILFFSIYKYELPVSKNFLAKYYGYFIAGILVSLGLILMFEFYKPLFKILEDMENRKKRK